MPQVDMTAKRNGAPATGLIFVRHLLILGYEITEDPEPKLRKDGE